MPDSVAAFATSSVSDRSARALIINVIVVVPVHVESAGSLLRHRLPNVDRDESHAAFNQPSAKQVALASVAASVPVADGVGFFTQLKRLLRERIGQQIGRLLREIGKRSDRVLLCRSPRAR